MRNTRISVFVISIFAILFSLQNGASAQAKDLNDALELAKNQKRKIIVDVYTDWCGWCKKMDRDAYSNQAVKELISEHFILVKLDAEGSGKNNYKGRVYTDSELSGYFQVSGYPTTVFLNPDGTIIEFKYDNFGMNNLPGYYTADEFKKVLEFIKNEKYKDTDLSTVI
jgi:thioredoxin-related protein